MSYLNEFEQELKAKLNSAEAEEAIIRWIPAIIAGVHTFASRFAGIAR